MFLIAFMPDPWGRETQDDRPHGHLHQSLARWLVRWDFVIKHLYRAVNVVPERTNAAPTCFHKLQEMQGAQKRQQQLQQRLLQVISQQQVEAGEGATTAQTAATANSFGAEPSSSAQAVAAGQDASGAGEGGGLVRALSGAVLGAALPLVGIFLR